MSTAGHNSFDASASATGYLYQCRYALLEALQQIQTNPEVAITLERFDDIAVNAGVAGREWIQTKHHRGKAGRLTNASADLWGTLRVWSENLASGRLGLPGTMLWIVTSATAPAGSIAAQLRPAGRKPAQALKSLVEVAQTSESKENQPAYTAFMKLSTVARRRLVNAVHVFDHAPLIEDLPRRLEEALWPAATREHLPHLVRRLEGWWFDRVIEHLGGARNDAITGDEFRSVVDDLREQFASDNLPIDRDLPPRPAAVPAKDERQVFVAQLRLLQASPQRILYALHDYYRACAQRSRWVREGLLRPGELGDYEARLREEWGRKFDLRVAALEPTATEAARCEVGNRLYEQVIEDFRVYIRARCDAPFVMRGTYHDLSDRLEVGWHPDFEARLRRLLGLGERSA